MTELSPRSEFIEEIKLRLGASMVDLELDPEDYELSVKMAFRRYRMRSSRALEESFIMLPVSKQTSIYTLPNEVQEVRSVYRSNMGAIGNAGAAIDPFGAAFVNNIYMVQNPGGIPGGGAGTLALYDFAMQYQEQVGRMFGRDLQFTWNAGTKKINFHRTFRGDEKVALHCHMTKPDDVLLNDPYARVWLQDFSVAVCKQMLGEGRGKFSSYAGPQGGVTMNGAELKQEAVAEQERLENELKSGADSAGGYHFIMG